MTIIKTRTYFAIMITSERKLHTNRNSSGFTMIELMIVIAIIGILATVAIPQYGRYVERAKFTDIITTTSTYKTAVSLCMQEDNGPDTCTPGDHSGIPPNLGASGVLQSLTTEAGVILATGTDEVGGHTYQLSPTWTADTKVEWVASGTCRNAGYCPEK